MMSAHLLDDPEQISFLLINRQQQLSLWPQTLPLPPGWSVYYGPASQQLCLGHLQQLAGL